MSWVCPICMRHLYIALRESGDVGKFWAEVEAHARKHANA